MGQGHVPVILELGGGDRTVPGDHCAVILDVNKLQVQ